MKNNMCEEEEIDDLNEFEKRLQTFEFKSTSLVYGKWDGTSTVKNVYNREKRRKHRSKEDQILNRLDLWVNVCQIRKEPEEELDLENVKYATVNLCRIRRPFLRRTVSLEDSSNITCATKFTGMWNKKRNKIYDGFFRSKSSLSTASGPHDSRQEDTDILDVILSESCETHNDDRIIYEENDHNFRINRGVNRIRNIERNGHSKYAKTEEQNTWTTRLKNSRNEDEKRVDSVKVLRNNTETSSPIRLLPSKCPVDDVFNASDSPKSSKEAKILVENWQNKYNPYPLFYKSNAELNYKKQTKSLNDMTISELHGICDIDPRRRQHSNSSENTAIYRSGIGKSDDECNNTITQNIRMYDTYNTNKMRYYKDNPQYQSIKRSQDICTMQDYINSIKESRSSIKQCTKDIKDFLGSTSNLTKSENMNGSVTPDANTPISKRKCFLISSSTPDISRLVSKSDEKPRRSLFSRDDYRRSWSDIKSILQNESQFKEYLV